VSVLFLVAQTPLHCLRLRFVQWSVGEVDLGLSGGQLGPVQRIKWVVWEEYFPHKRAGKERIRSLECIQDETRTSGFSAGELILANSNDRCDLRSHLVVWSDFDGPALNVAYVSFDIALIGLELDVLW
jgi:hypothetical protein